jgi:hypothetical protein
VGWHDPAAETVDVANRGRYPSSMLSAVLRKYEPSQIRDSRRICVTDGDVHYH